ncbi:MAG: intein-containing translation initiation factor IF-2, partial [Candidatus Aenigmarchaeota archaeon]|nr:intein-containing translation initiation factor IF-2 [Candidatus Aenigmarchaeota archaeon]
MLDSIRGTIVQKGEAGGITQGTGTSFIPIDVIKGFCGDLLKKLKIDVKIPGLLFIDTPGHEAFTTLRRRGGSIADLAILVIDINKGFQPQTDESLEYLKKFKTPFVVA